MHFVSDALTYAVNSRYQTALALINTLFNQETAEAAGMQLRAVHDAPRNTFPKLATLMDDPKQEVLAFMNIPKPHLTETHSSYPVEWVNARIIQLTDAVRIFTNKAAGHRPFDTRFFSTRTRVAIYLIRRHAA